MRILLVDDSKVERQLVGNVLAMQGHQVHIAETLAQGRDALEKHAFDAVILDVILPDWNSIEDTVLVCEQALCPVVIHTSHVYLEAVDRLRGHAAYVVEKTYELKGLLDALTSIELGGA